MANSDEIFTSSIKINNDGQNITSNLYSYASTLCNIPETKVKELVNEMRNEKVEFVKEEKTMVSKYKDILDIWENGHIAQIEKKVNRNIDGLINEDKCVLIIKEMEEKISKLNKDVSFYYRSYITEETKEKIEGLIEERNKYKDKIHRYRKEVTVMLQVTETYEQAKEVLLNYGVLSKNGQIEEYD